MIARDCQRDRFRYRARNGEPTCPTIAERLISPISTAELERRWAAVRAAMAAQNIDVLVMQNSNEFSGGYVKWFTDMPSGNGTMTTVIFPKDDLMTVVAPGPFGIDVAPPPGDPVRRGVKRFLASPNFMGASFTTALDLENIDKAMAEYSGATIGLVAQGSMGHALGEHLKHGKLGNARFVDATELVDRLMVIKSDEEIALIRATAHLQDRAMRAAFDAIKPGMRDIEVTAGRRDLHPQRRRGIRPADGRVVADRAIGDDPAAASAEPHRARRRPVRAAGRDHRPRRLLLRDRPHLRARQGDAEHEGRVRVRDARRRNSRRRC